MSCIKLADVPYLFSVWTKVYPQNEPPVICRGADAFERVGEEGLLRIHHPRYSGHGAAG